MKAGSNLASFFLSHHMFGPSTNSDGSPKKMYAEFDHFSLVPPPLSSLFIGCGSTFCVSASAMINFGHESVQFSCSVMSDSLWPHGLQHSRLPCPWPTPGAYSNSCPSRPWCHPTISSSVVPFSSCFQSFPASGSFPMSRLFAKEVTKILELQVNLSPSSEYWGLISFRIDWFDFLAVKGTLKSLL